MIIGQAAPAARLGIYFFYDPAGIVDDYVLHMLQELRPHLSDLIVVCNGKLSAAGRDKLESVDGAKVLVRPNVGFDVWAYKTALDYVGWDRLETYDEVILQNFTIMGPVNPLADMFASMDARDVDFWGITIHNGASFDPWGTMPDGCIPVHLQSHFIAVRQKMVASYEFQAYWDTMGLIESYTDAVSKHEAMFTKRFADMGFTWDVYVDTHDLIGKMYYPLFNVPIELIQNRNCPVFKRKSFFAGPPAYLEENSNRAARELLDYLRLGDRFDDELLIPHLLRSCHLSDLQSSLNLYEIIPTHGDEFVPAGVGALAYVDSVATAREILPYLGNLTGIDIIVVVDDSPGLLPSVEALFAGASVDAELVTGNRTLAALPLLAKYDVACVLDVAGEEATFPFTISDALNSHNRTSVLASRAYVRGVVDLFAADPFLGMLVPTPPVHSRYYGDLGHEWAATFDMVDDHLTALGLSVPRDAKHHPVAPVGGCFWFRPIALAVVADAIERGELAVSATVDRSSRDAVLALRQTLPFAAQAAGYFTSHLTTPELAANMLTNMTHIVREVNKTVGRGPGEHFTTLVHNIGYLVAHEQSRPSERHVENRSAVYWNRGAGYYENDRLDFLHEASIEGAGPLLLEFTIPAGVTSIRFDPIEGAECVCIGVRLESDAPLEIRPINATIVGDVHFFSTTDPQYMISGKFVEGTSVRIVIDELHFSAMAPRILKRLALNAEVGALVPPVPSRRAMRPRRSRFEITST